jgi:hypothetical protein
VTRLSDLQKASEIQFELIVVLCRKWPPHGFKAMGCTLFEQPLMPRANAVRCLNRAASE